MFFVGTGMNNEQAAMFTEASFQGPQLRIVTHVVFGAQLSDCGQVAGVRHHHPSFTLDGLHHKSCSIRVLKGFLEKGRRTHSHLYLDSVKPSQEKPTTKVNHYNTSR